MSQSLVPTNQTELVEAWQNLSPPRKIGLATLMVVAIAGIIFFITWAQTPEYTAAFTDISAEDGAAIVAYLKENNISYQLGNGGTTISVPSNQVHEVRLALAGQGLPSEGAVGMELFDNTNLGMTEFIQQVNYQRALEGELARTISSLNAVQSARVHIVIPQPSLFSEEEEPTTASVVLKLEPNQTLKQEQVKAISHLVSSAVEGLDPANLTIVDMDGNVLADGSDTTTASGVILSANQLDTQRAFERDMERRVETMLENVLGPDKAVVRVNAVMNWDQVQTESETYVPADQGGNVLRSSRQLTETYAGDAASTGGIPGTASNIPDAAASYQTEITGTNGSSYQRTDVTTNYEVSRSVSHVTAATGQIERLSVSVMVDNITDTVTINAIEQATIAAAGIDQTRGDVLTVNSIPFDRTAQLEQAAAMEATQQQEFYLQLARWGAIGIALIALFFVVRSLQRSMRPAEAVAVAEAGPSTAASSAEEAAQALMRKVREGGELSAEDLEGLELIGPPSFNAKQKAAAEKAQMLRQLQLVAKNRPETLAQIIQFWITEDINA